MWTYVDACQLLPHFSVPGLVVTAMRLWLRPVLLLLSAIGSYCQYCPIDWVMYGDKCYKYMDARMTWNDAEEACGLIHSGCTLASAHDLEQNAFLSESVAGNTIAWLGLRRASKNSSWVWTDGSTYDFEYWYHGFPVNDDDQCARQHCYEPGMWCSKSCNDAGDEYAFICQIDF